MSAELLLLCGSLRSASTNAAALRTAALAPPPGVTATMYDGLASLPPLNPDDDVAGCVPPGAAGLRAAVRAASGLLICTPEYAGGLPGSFKNLLDWTIGDDQPGSIYGKPVAWINVSPHGAEHAHRELGLVLGYAHAEVVAAACARVPVTRGMVGADGLVADPDVAAGLRASLAALAAVCRTG